MGAGASRSVVQGEVSVRGNHPPHSVPSTLPEAWTQDGDGFFPAVSHDADIFRKSETIVLEVGPQGFRLLRPNNGGPLTMLPWGCIHSWSHAPRFFAFRWYDDVRQDIREHAFTVRDAQPILTHIQRTVDAILVARKEQAITEPDFLDLLRAVRSAGPTGSALEVVMSRAQVVYFTSEQGRHLMDALPNIWDQVEAAVALHGRLVDQPNFVHMLNGLDGQSRDNVWHRVTLKRRAASLARTESNTRASSKAAASPAKAAPGQLATRVEPEARGETADQSADTAVTSVGSAAQSVKLPPIINVKRPDALGSAVE